MAQQQLKRITEELRVAQKVPAAGPVRGFGILSVWGWRLWGLALLGLRVGTGPRHRSNPTPEPQTLNEESFAPSHPKP